MPEGRGYRRNKPEEPNWRTRENRGHSWFTNMKSEREKRQTCNEIARQLVMGSVQGVPTLRSYRPFYISVQERARIPSEAFGNANGGVCYVMVEV